jgi:hypothetical protein
MKRNTHESTAMALKRRYKKIAETKSRGLNRNASTALPSPSSRNTSSGLNTNQDDDRTVRTTASQRSMKERLKTLGKPLKPLRKLIDKTKRKQKNKISPAISRTRDEKMTILERMNPPKDESFESSPKRSIPDSISFASVGRHNCENNSNLDPTREKCDPIASSTYDCTNIGGETPGSTSTYRSAKFYCYDQPLFQLRSDDFMPYFWSLLLSFFIWTFWGSSGVVIGWGLYFSLFRNQHNREADEERKN